MKSKLHLILLLVGSAMAGSAMATESYDAIFTAHFAKDEPGANVLVMKNNEVIYQQAFGKADLGLDVDMGNNMLFPIGSISKQFTAVAILKLVEQEKINLDNAVSHYLPDFPDLSHTITIRHLLTHTSGLENYIARQEWRQHWRNDFSLKDMRQHYVHYPLKFAPGQQFDYSNSGYLLLAEIIEAVSGMSYADFVGKYLFEPASMPNSVQLDNFTVYKNMPRGYIPHGTGNRLADFVSMTHMVGPGSLASTVQDLSNWNKALFNGAIINESLLREALSSYQLNNNELSDYGFGWELKSIRGKSSYEHGGYMYGYFSAMLTVPDENILVVILTNSRKLDPRELAVKAAATAMKLPFPKADYIETSTDIAEQWVGVYRDENNIERTIGLLDNSLYIRRGNGQRWPLKLSRAGYLHYEQGLSYLALSDDGKTLELHQREGVSSRSVKLSSDVKPIVTQKLNQEHLSLIAGTYQLAESFNLTVFAEDGRIFIQGTGQNAGEVLAYSPLHLFAPHDNAEFVFAKDEHGGVSHLKLIQGGQEYLAPKINL
ncbi:hypothetical protein GCM10010919_00970 [Alishewanella longhuensis]|uniref:Beta-lactamase-related domain-containing protein n=1 Tax=Alishewanella longhuensis TaxID=1091037 RepID=A0ABQ3KSP7_9ALTE|nr:serine hydrolase domain-containing protein [Alishewanella longhuensis]GHG58908.1 hypothetical protein GCM10010919_00970 [Alishewanella longhuensis]